MADGIITKQELIDAKVDAQTLEDCINGAPNTKVQARLGREYWTLSTIDHVVQLSQEKYQDLIDAINTIVVDNGIPALAVSDKSGITQQEINDLGGVRYWTEESGGYQVNYEVRLANGDIVKNTVPNNTTNPNVDMTGWEKTNNAKQLDYSFQLDRVLRSVQSRLSDDVSVRDFGAVGDGVLHKVSEWNQIGSRIYYPNLAAIQVDYPHVTSSNDSVDWAATQKAVNTPNIYRLRFPCNTSIGRYEFGSNELIIPDSRSNITFIGDGSADVGATVIRSTPNKNGFIAINSKAYATTLQDLALLSTTGNDDGFYAIGFLHMRDVTGSTGRLTHRNLRIQGFSKHACKIGQAINYQFDNITFSGGVETLWIGRNASINQRSTTVSMYHAYITSGKRCGVYLDRPSDFMADRLIIESCGKGANPITGTFYEDAAGLIAVGVGQCQLNAPYFEDNRRNIWSNSSIVTIAANYAPATLPNVWDFSDPNAADADKGRIELLRNGIRTRFIRADEYKGYIEVADDIRFNASAKFNIELISKALFIGSSSKHGRVDGAHELTINSNMSGAANIGVVGQKLNFGVTNSSVGITSRWMTLGHRRLDNTNTALGIYVDSGTTNFAPDGAPVKLAEFNSKLGLVLAPKASATPEINGEMTFELTSNTQLKVKVMGSDGVVRSTTLALA